VYLTHYNKNEYITVFFSLFHNAFSLTTLYNDDDEQTRTSIHTLSEIRTHSLSIQAIKAYASDRMATGTGLSNVISFVTKDFIQQ
jgi:hypothetical protein